MINKIFKPNWLPNRNGYKFMALIEENDGHFWEPAEIKINEKTGLHYVSGLHKPIEYKKIVGWLRVDEKGNAIQIG